MTVGTFAWFFPPQPRGATGSPYVLPTKDDDPRIPAAQLAVIVSTLPNGHADLFVFTMGQTVHDVQPTQDRKGASRTWGTLAQADGAGADDAKIAELVNKIEEGNRRVLAATDAVSELRAHVELLLAGERPPK